MGQDDRAGGPLSSTGAGVALHQWGGSKPWTRWPQRTPLALLESFHPQRSNHLADQDKLTRREASHFIIAIATEEDGSEKKRRH
jgi:hypothetical protein